MAGRAGFISLYRYVQEDQWVYVFKGANEYQGQMEMFFGLIMCCLFLYINTSLSFHVGNRMRGHFFLSVISKMIENGNLCFFITPYRWSDIPSVP